MVSGVMDQVNGYVSDGVELSGYYEVYGAGQAFTGNGAKILSAKFHILMGGYIWESVHAVVYAHSGTFGSDGIPIGSPLAVSESIDVSELPTSYADWISFNFIGSNQFQTVAGTKYFVVLEFVDHSASHYTFLYLSLTNQASAFNGGTSVVYGDDWGAFTSGRVMFQIIGDQAVPTYNITYVGNDASSGNALIDNNSYVKGDMVSIASNSGSLVRTNYVLAGWSTNPAAALPDYTFVGSNVNPSALNMPPHNLTLYAIWHQFQPCTLTYDAYGGGVAPTDVNSPYQKGTTVTVLSADRIYPTFDLGYWYNPCTGEIYYPGDTFVITKDTVLLADWVAGIPSPPFYVLYSDNGATGGSVPIDNTAYAHGSLVTVLGKGTLVKANHSFVGWAKNCLDASADYQAGNKFSYMGPVVLYAVWHLDGTIIVDYNECYGGLVGSKQVVNAYNNVSPIVKVVSNLPNNVGCSAVVENLVIDGCDLVNNVTGILLENVCNCLIRNVTIKNCVVGIKVRVSGGGAAFGNRFEHIRMINVKTGILFESVGGGGDFSCTVIDDVGISLEEDREDVSDVGIKVGVNVDLYSAFVRANVWLAKSRGTGLDVSGKLGFSLVSFVVEQDVGYDGCGVHVSSGATVSNNQSFHLTALKLPSNRVVDDNSPANNDIVVGS